jgi:hypothetical protein
MDLFGFFDVIKSMISSAFSGRETMHTNPLDRFEDLSGWTAITSGQEELHISPRTGDCRGKRCAWISTLAGVAVL